MKSLHGIIIVILVSLLATGFIIWFSFFGIEIPQFSFSNIFFPVTPSSTPPLEEINKFSNEEDFKDYLEKGGAYSEYLSYAGAKVLAPTAVEEMGMGAEDYGVERVSETNVQVAGIDEPDIVKTDGKEIYFSQSYFSGYWEESVLEEKMISPYYPENKTKIIKAFPPAYLAENSEIDKSGELLLSKNILVVFSENLNYGREVYGYDVLDPKSPQKKWDLKLEEDNYIIDARLYQDKIYLVVQSRINEIRPCPIKILETNGNSLNVQCGDIYHPVSPIPVDTTFTAMILDPVSGEIENKISFVGSTSSSIVYMSENSIYITYSYYESVIKFFANFLEEKCQDLIPGWLIDKTKKLESYDIGQSAKMVEFEEIWQRYVSSLSDDEELKLENEISNRINDYYDEHKRELEQTGILKIGVEEFKIEAVGSVPGYPLNQFALDEYQDNLRIAVTVGERWLSLGMTSTRESANDVYVLNKDLNIEGSVKDLGETERIYSARFIEDKGYLVTFRQTDPFYVLDLSDPKNPELKGELKIPGYSSYLHPITKDKILGIGQEDWRVKISLFDVSSASDPKELKKYILDEYWSEVLSTHHAFLLDTKHEIFFLPGSQGGYIFSYKNDKLELVKAVSQTGVKRAIYINDYLYIISETGITVFNELDWQKVNSLTF